MLTLMLRNSFTFSKKRIFVATIAGVISILSGCSTAPSQADSEKKTPTTKAPETKPAENAANQTPKTTPECLCPPTSETKPEVEPPRGKLVPSDWQALPDWGKEIATPLWTAFLQSCSANLPEPTWQRACTEATALSQANGNNIDLKTFFETYFKPYQVINADSSTSGMITGYYEPLLYGSRTKSDKYRYPLYAEPSDLLTIDLSSIYPELKHKRLRGRLEGNKVVPYYNRADIERPDTPAAVKDKVLVWVNDPVEVAFLHIQGSGQVLLDTGETMRVGYANQNGYPFRSVGRYLIQQRILTPAQTSLQGIRAWAQKNPDKIETLLNFNPSYVFFRELPLNLPGPLGSLGVPLTAEYSMAVDRRVIPLGMPVYLSTTWPNTNRPLNRLMMAQDTGGAINGGVRADFYWGFGDEALKYAGVMKQQGQMWVLLPNGYPIPKQ